jgi:protein KRI1
MPKRKADASAPLTGANGTKKIKQDTKNPNQAEARANLLVDSDSGSDEEEAGGAPLENGFKINEEYAKRFEHNKKREELQRCRKI